MPALLISQVTVTDDTGYGKYAALSGLAILAHGGRFGARVVQMEGPAGCGM